MELILVAGVWGEDDVCVAVMIKAVGLRSPGNVTRDAVRKNEVGFGVGMIAEEAAWTGMLDGARVPKSNLCALPGPCAGGIPNPGVGGPGIELVDSLDVYGPVVLD